MARCLNHGERCRIRMNVTIFCIYIYDLLAGINFLMKEKNVLSVSISVRNNHERLYFCSGRAAAMFKTDSRVWKGFCVIRDSAEIERVIREYRENLAVTQEFYMGCDAGFSHL